MSAALQRCAKGDRAAFEFVYETTAPRLTAIVSNMVQDPDAVRDILQKAYLAVWRSAGKYDPSKGLAFTWILVVARNKALDALRAQARQAVMEELDEGLEDETASVQRQAEAALLRRTLEPALARLPRDMARCIHLNVVEGLTCREISDLIDVPTNTVKSWVRRGLSRLRRDLPFDTLSQAL